MRLKTQLLLLALLSLSLPWAGVKLIQKVESALRTGQEQSSLVTSHAIATALRADLPTPPDKPGVFFDWLDIPVQIDGYISDWQDYTFDQLPGPDQRVLYKTLRDKNHAYVLISVQDQDIQFYNPSGRMLRNGDRVHLQLDDYDVNLTPSAPGRLSARYLQRGKILEHDKIIAYWRDTANGYQLEIKLPIDQIRHRFSLAVVDHAAEKSAQKVWRSISNATPIYASQQLRESLAAFVTSGSKLTLVNPQGWPLISLGSSQSKSPNEVHWVLRRVYRALLTEPSKTQLPEKVGLRQEVTNALAGKSAQQWYVHNRLSGRHILSSAQPIISNEVPVAALLIEQSSEPFLTLTDAAFSTLIGSSIIALLITIMGLIAYASWLSWRIRALSTATANSLSSDGSIQKTLPQQHANDEIGELSRSFSALLGNISEFTDYLQSLSNKLSHELRTPLAVVRSSLDNLAAEDLPEQAKVYQNRAQQGAEQLSHLLTALSEASRVEQSISTADKEVCDVASLLQSMQAAYQDIYTSHTIALTIKEQVTAVDAAPELVVQMLDKLISNAVDFAIPNSQIDIIFEQKDKHASISVLNQGPLLNPQLRGQLFDSMVSLREQTTRTTPHLGLGLYIVKLIASYHNGSVEARDLADGSGVAFTVTLALS